MKLVSVDAWSLSLFHHYPCSARKLRHNVIVGRTVSGRRRVIPLPRRATSQSHHRAFTLRLVQDHSLRPSVRPKWDIYLRFLMTTIPTLLWHAAAAPAETGKEGSI